MPKAKKKPTRRRHPRGRRTPTTNVTLTGPMFSADAIRSISESLLRDIRLSDRLNREYDNTVPSLEDRRELEAAATPGAPHPGPPNSAREWVERQLEEERRLRRHGELEVGETIRVRLPQQFRVPSGPTLQSEPLIPDPTTYLTVEEVAANRERAQALIRATREHPYGQLGVTPSRTQLMYGAPVTAREARVYVEPAWPAPTSPVAKNVRAPKPPLPWKTSTLTKARKRRIKVDDDDE